MGADCHGLAHQAICKCPVGTRGDPFVSCITIGCQANDECPSDKACVNGRCESPCAINDVCAPPSECRVYDHNVDCACPPGFIGTRGTSCQRGIVYNFYKTKSPSKKISFFFSCKKKYALIIKNSSSFSLSVYPTIFFVVNICSCGKFSMICSSSQSWMRE